MGRASTQLSLRCSGLVMEERFFRHYLLQVVLIGVQMIQSGPRSIRWVLMLRARGTLSQSSRDSLEIDELLPCPWT